MVDGDFTRPLSARGSNDAPRMGRYIAAQGYAPDRVIASPATRTTETAELICAELPDADADAITYDRRLYHGSAEQIRAIAEQQLREVSCVLMVAHNPGMEDAVLSFCPHAPTFADGKLMPTCALAVIDIIGNGDGEATLRELLRPSELPT